MAALISFITADDQMLRRVRELMEARGHQVVHAGTGRGLPSADEEPALVIVDTCLQDADAPAVVCRLGAADSGRPPVLILAERDQAEAAVAAMNAGAEDVLFRPLDPLGLPLRVEALLLRAELAASQERERTLEYRNQELVSFIYIVTHDMKTPVVNLQGLVGLIEQDHGTDLPSEVTDYLSRLKRNAERLEELLRDLLVYPSTLSVVGPLKIEPMSEILAAAMSGLEDMASDKGVELVLAEDLPSVQCDGKRVQQIFHNLIENAIKHASVVSEPRVEVGWTRTSKGPRYHVKDNGPGIPAEQLTDIFRLFHRVPDGAAEGTGIGLAVARHLVDAHGGEVWCESAVDEGSSFFFTLSAGS